MANPITPRDTVQSTQATPPRKSKWTALLVVAVVVLLSVRVSVPLVMHALEQRAIVRLSYAGHLVESASLKSIATADFEALQVVFPRPGHQVWALFERFSDADIEQLKWISDVRAVDCRSATIDDANLAKIVDAAPAAMVLELCNNSISDSGLQSVRSMRELAYIGLAGTHVTEAGVQSLRDIPRLAYLDISRCNFDSLHLRDGFRQLKRIIADRTSINSLQVSGLPALETLDSPGEADRNAESVKLRDLPLVTRASINGYQLGSSTDRSFEMTVDNLPLLETLTIKARDGSQIRLSDIPALRSLVLDTIDSPVLVLQQLTDCQRLSRIELYYCFFEDDEGAELFDALARLPALRELRLHSRPEEALREIIRLQSLESLDLTGAQITDEHLDVLLQLPRLQALAISDNPALSARAVDIIAAMPSLTSVTLSNGQDRLPEWTEQLKSRLRASVSVLTSPIE